MKPVLFFFSHSTEIVHVWKDAQFAGEGPTHSAQMVIDGVSYLSETVYSIGAQPSKVLTDWVADKFAPSYWKPNNEIIVSSPFYLEFYRFWCVVFIVRVIL